MTFLSLAVSQFGIDEEKLNAVYQFLKKASGGGGGGEFFRF